MPIIAPSDREVTSPTFVLDSRPSRAKRIQDLLGSRTGTSLVRTVTNLRDVRESLAIAGSDSLWVSYTPNLTFELLKSAARSSLRLGSAVLVHEFNSQSVPMLANSFRDVVFGKPDCFLPPEELAEVLSAPNRKDLFISGTVDPDTCTITFGRGNLDSIVVPFSAFRPSGAGVVPDFSDFAIADCGQKVRLGEYEAAVDAILYEFDAEYRRRLKKRRIASQKTFGASLRRLRLQKKVARSDFPGLSEKTLARIERGEIVRDAIRPRTLAAIAKRLGVEVEEIGSF